MIVFVSKHIDFLYYICKRISTQRHVFLMVFDWQQSSAGLDVTDTHAL